MLERWLAGPLRLRWVLPSAAAVGAVLVALVMVNVQIHGGYLIAGVPHQLRSAALATVVVPAVLLFLAAIVLFLVGLACLPLAVGGLAVYGLIRAFRRRSV
ncbi:MAG TPA: hypothetical protein VIA06_03840 [Candidatus Dormibacteraeota bacterium]|jgi:hypothetical protein|nr:hypothetical protein [Candidatus Dormibacteraeota bacterium]